MRLINTQFTFVLIILFVLNICNVTSRNSKYSIFLKRFSHIQPSKLFKRDCENEIKDSKLVPRQPNIGDDPSSKECMLYCGFTRIGMIHYPGVLNEVFLNKKIGPDQEKALKKIHECTSVIQLDNRYFCLRAMKKIECAFEHIGITETIKNEVQFIMEYP
ncbi:uncharacterized protein LOC135850026 [Planococcus citri]|uniref:uncharacterized protein LOC135850026 n=1 Tax=Planococcus citri TaxID=170843 RepID=UPI0031F86CD1